MLKLTASQQVVADALVAWATDDETADPMVTLSGYAGTGKTTVISYCVEAWLAAGLRVALCAPTNKAVGVLEQKISAHLLNGARARRDEDGFVVDGDADPQIPEFEAKSVHSMLGMKLEEQEDGTQRCVAGTGEAKIQEYDVVAVDEASMVTADLFRHLIAHRGRTRIVFVGDSMQLPPVGEREIAAPFRVVTRRYELSEVVRQAAENPIIGFSMALRRWIQDDHRPDAADIVEALGAQQPRCTLTYGTQQTIRDYCVHAIRAGLDARIVAYMNRTVVGHNDGIHEALYGVTEFPFVAGERVIAQEAFVARDIPADMTAEQLERLERDHRDEDEGRLQRGRDAARTKGVQIMNSEELIVEHVEAAVHPRYPNVAAFRITARTESGRVAKCLAARDERQREGEQRALWADWRRLKADADAARARRDHSGEATARTAAKKASAKAWAFKKAFAPLRHTYAITAHKSQGSTFHTVIVDFSDVERMRTAFDMGRSLYVAVTRAAENVAMVSQ